MEKFKLPELPSVLTEHIKMVPKDVITSLIEYVNALAEAVNAHESQLSELQSDTATLANNVKSIAEILEDELYA